MTKVKQKILEFHYWRNNIDFRLRSKMWFFKGGVAKLPKTPFVVEDCPI